MMTRRSTVAAFALSLAFALPAQAAGTVNVYSFRQPELLAPLFEKFTAETGIEVKTLFADKGLIERMEQEGPLSPADVLLTADVGRLVLATEKGLGQPLDNESIKAQVPETMRDAGNQWFGLTMRARVVYASKERVKQDVISYEELATPKWKGKICTRPGNHPYNLGLISTVIAHQGREAAKQWLTGLKSNLAIKPSGNDREQAKGVFAGECDLAIANTYYMGLMQTNEKQPEQRQWAESARILFPSSPDIGTHVNISGMMLTKSAPNKESAIKLMEFLASPVAQELYATQNFEYPVNPALKASPTVEAWGKLVPDKLNLAEIAKHEKEALQLVDEVGYND